MVTELLRFSRRSARRLVLYLLSEEGHLTWEERLCVVEDSLDALDAKCKDNRAHLQEFLDCGHFSTEHERQ